jgi:glycosyltransferase involved in cell wall biosynthesis
MYYPVKALVEAGHEVCFWSMYEQMSEMHDIVNPEIIKRSPLDFIFKKFAKNNDFLKTKISLPCFPILGWRLFRYNPDIILIKDTQTFFSIFMLIWCAILRKNSYLLVQTNKHSVRSRIKKLFVWWLKNICCVKGVITPLKDENGISDPFFKYIPFVYDVKEIEKEHFKNNKINIIDIGKFQKRKDHLLLIKAVERLKDKYDIRLTIVGEKMDVKIEDEIQQYISANKLDDVVKVFVNMNPKEVQKMYLDNDLYILPSYDEPAAYSIVEAMAHGLPVIASDTCGTKCYIEERENGYVFKSKDVDDLAEKIELIIKDRHNLVKMGKRSYAVARKEHNYRNFSNIFERIIK